MLTLCSSGLTTYLWLNTPSADERWRYIDVTCPLIDWDFVKPSIENAPWFWYIPWFISQIILICCETFYWHMRSQTRLMTAYIRQCYQVNQFWIRSRHKADAYIHYFPGIMHTIKALLCSAMVCYWSRLPILSRVISLVPGQLTHLPLVKMAAISQTIFSDTFSGKKIFVSVLKFPWNWQ